MNNQKINIANCTTKKMFKGALLIIISALLIGRADAVESETAHSSVSYGEVSQALTDETRASITSKNAALASDQTTGKATGQTREEIQASDRSSAILQPMSRSYAPEFSIYTAFTTLYDDFDRDGFYQTFSVVFDADMYSPDGYDSSAVYARLYLSENGGPWRHYYTTDNFIINGESELDEYEVLTTFLEGYHPEHYDLLIDLYQVGNPYVVATFSSDDSDQLYALPLESSDYDQVYALPLESSDYDQVYIEAVHVNHGGSLSIWLITLLLLPLAGRLSRGFIRGVKDKSK